MTDFKAVKKVIITLAVLFGVNLGILVLTVGRLNYFSGAALTILLVVGIYFTVVALKLLALLRNNHEK